MEARFACWAFKQGGQEDVTSTLERAPDRRARWGGGHGRASGREEAGKEGLKSFR